MLADLDLLLIYVFCIADDLLPEKPFNHRRSLTDAEVVTLAVAQQIMGIPSDYRFIHAAIRQLGHLFPALTKRSGFFKRRDRLTGTIEQLAAILASNSPGWEDDLLLVDSTPVECARSTETVKRSGHSSLDDALGNAADYGYCASHSRLFYGFRLHTLCALDGTPRMAMLTSPKENERDVALRMLERVNRNGDGKLTVIADKGYAGREFTAQAAALNATILRPMRNDETVAETHNTSTPALIPASQITAHPRPKPPRRPHLAPIRQRIESIYWTAKDILTLERHGARTLHGLRVRIAARLLTLAAAVALNHQLGLPSRSLAQYTA
ncbi:MAG: transposase [Actinomycetota bacterium]|nr:transposase [Actinomycetota bacterium]